VLCNLWQELLREKRLSEKDVNECGFPLRTPSRRSAQKSGVEKEKDTEGHIESPDIVGRKNRLQRKVGGLWNLPAEPPH
jgi:hypothetical protein